MTEHGTTNRQPVLYRVLRNRKLSPGGRYYDVTTAEAEGMCWVEAKALSDRLQREEAEAKPLQTSWTIDIFFCERMDAKKSQVGMSLRVSRRRKRKSTPAVTKPRGRATQLVMQWR